LIYFFLYFLIFLWTQKWVTTSAANRTSPLSLFLHRGLQPPKPSPLSATTATPPRTATSITVIHQHRHC
jgi:hypothetical protein